MANELLKTLTIDGVSQDIFEAGNFLSVDANNKLNLNIVRKYMSAGISGSVPNNSATLVDMIDIPVNGYLVGRMSIAFTSNANGIRSLQAMRQGEAVNRGALNVPASQGGQTMLTVPICLYVDNSTVKLQARIWQNSGVSLAYSGLYFAGFFISRE